MAFLQIKRDSIYLTIDNNPKPIRPLLPEALGKWVHMIPSCVQIAPGAGGKEQKKELRRFTMVDADFSRWFKDNPDPLWDLLDVNDKFTRDGKRQDFAVRPQHILPVWSYMDNDVKIVKQGNQFFEEMVKYYDAGGKVADCDWLCWTEGSGRTKQYQTSRQDKSPFTPPIDPNLIGQKIQAVMKQALEDLRPFKTEEDMLKYIYGHAADEATSFPFGANAPAQLPAPTQQPNVPAYMPGGASPTTLGAPPIPQQPPQQAWAPPPQQQWGNTSAAPQPAPWTPPANTSAAPQPAPWAPPGNSAVPPQQQPQWTPPQAQGWAPPQAPAQQAQGWAPPQQPAQQPQWAPPQQPKVEVPNAPVSSAPTFAPPQPPQQQIPQNQPGTPPAMFVVASGKHAGKTLGWIKDNDAPYLTFLKGNKKELAPMIEALLGGMPAPAPAPTQAPAQQQQLPMSGDGEAMRAQMVRDINQKIMSLPEFQGPGVMNLGPFLQQTIGTAAFSDAPLDQLQILKNAVEAKLAQGRA